jgi:transcriptional regulator with XRE-family HTH domain
MTERIETFRGRQLRKELLRLREAAGLSMEEIGQRLDWSKAKISRIETGRNRVTPSDVRLLLDEYGITDEQERQVLMTLAREARKQGWWHNYTDVIASPYVGFEAEASALRIFQTQLVPGLFQTEEYVHALLRSARPALQPAEIDRRVAARMARQELLTRTDAPDIWVILDETVLRRLVGGPSAMRGQLDRLAEAAGLPNVTIQILPFGAGSHTAMGVPFIILDFDAPPTVSAVYLEHLTGELFLDKEPDIARYTLAFDYLRAKAIDPEDVPSMITGIAEQL